MSLAEYDFSDLILLPDGRAFFKGTPEGDQQVVSVPEYTDDAVEEQEEVATLLPLVERKFEETRTTDDPFLGCVRIRHQGVSYRAAGHIGIEGRAYFLRRLAETVPDFSSLLLPMGVDNWLLEAENSKGLILFCGPQGSGKTTSAGSFVASRLRRHGGHSVSFENPVEMPLAGPHGVHGFCFQTEIREEAELGRHIERAHRFASPNIILIGEIRSTFTASEALRVSLGSSQQLVVATLHGLDITTALDRLLGWARESDGDMACQNLAHSLLAIVYQELTSTNGKRTLNVPQFLLIPFTDGSKGIRAKLRECRLLSLEDDIREQRNRIKLQGIDGAFS